MGLKCTFRKEVLVKGSELNLKKSAMKWHGRDWK
jgi:hypothetical protein